MPSDRIRHAHAPHQRLPQTLALLLDGSDPKSVGAVRIQLYCLPPAFRRPLSCHLYCPVADFIIQLPTLLCGYTSCTQIIKLETETDAKALIPNESHFDSEQIKLETGGRFRRPGQGRPDNKVGN